ncbi:RNA polymerase sigma factor [Thalassoroseus pseudoceratinae]|uniref:RNA polymerase sigma factor n=1 Tax=Thalassoroseus pseudoceratinae TaxID=2713176 RepID=UPI00141D9CF3|nr:sigma-70 family RNA polymerase sigma factor [Thalassoroseus pseudoceratinae]
MSPEPAETLSQTAFQRVHAGDADACELVVRVYGPIVYRWARREGLSDDVSQDLMQDVFLTVFRSFDPQRKGRFRHWLWRVFRSRLTDRFRREQKQPLSLGGTAGQQFFQDVPDLADTPPDEHSPDGQADQKLLLVRAVMAMKSRFQEHVWQAFWRVVIDGQPPSEVAAELKMSTWAVYKAKSRCLKLIQTELAGLEIEWNRSFLTQ